MSVNRHLPHVLVLPEDRANLQLANAFHLQIPPDRQRQMQVLGVAGGWTQVLERFKSEHLAEMDRNRDRFLVLLIDLDGNVERLAKAKAIIPGNLTDRVFVLGALNNPEDLKANLGPYDTIGLAMAKDCREGTNETWGHELLQHNASEVDRLREHVRPILFPAN